MLKKDVVQIRRTKGITNTVTAYIMQYSLPSFDPDFAKFIYVGIVKEGKYKWRAFELTTGLPFVSKPSKRMRDCIDDFVCENEKRIGLVYPIIKQYVKEHGVLNEKYMVHEEWMDDDL